jgi:hypothetical protein
MIKHIRIPGLATVSAALLACSAATLAVTAHADSGGQTLFISSAVEHADDTATFPLHRGTKGTQTIWYMVLDSSDGKKAKELGVNQSSKLVNAKGTAAVQKVKLVNGVIDFPATVDFRPLRKIQAGPIGSPFPPALAEPGAVGEPNYSPLIELPDGTILNAPHVINNSGQADKVVGADTVAGTVIYRETRGFQGGKAVKYVSTESSNPLAAALENVTWAPALDAAPFAGGDGTDSARASLAAFVNGQTGAGNPERQGLNSALQDGLDPLNVLAWNPSQGRYSPLWDVHLAKWSQQAVAAGQNTHQTDFGKLKNLAQKKTITAPGGTAFGASGFIVNCPIVSSE